MSRITCDYKGCKYNYNGVCQKSFVEIAGTVCQDREEEVDDE